MQLQADLDDAAKFGAKSGSADSNRGPLVPQTSTLTT